jgi:hypothetical protein
MCSLKAATACWRLEAGSWRLICQASFTAPLGTAGAPGLVLHFVASALIIDPDTGFPKIIEASDEKPIVVKPAGVEPPLSVSFTPPCDPFVVEPGAATSISIRIETSDPAGTTAAFRMMREDGTEVFSSPIDLSTFEVSGSVMTGAFGFTASSPTGNYLIEVHAFRGPETAVASGGVTVKAPMPPLALHVTTGSPLVKVEGDPAEVLFAITPPAAKPLLTDLKWRVEPWGQPGVPVFGAVLDPESLVDHGTYLEGAFSFTVPEGLVEEPTDFVLRVMAGGGGIGQAEDWIILRVSPKPPVPLALTIFSAPEAPVYETEGVSFGFFIAPKEVLPSITGIFWQVLDGTNSETLVAGNVPPESLEPNGYLSGACTFEVLKGLHRASNGTGAVVLRITVFTADGEAHDEQAFVVKPLPTLMVLEPFVHCGEGAEAGPIGIELAPGDAGVEALSFAVLSGDLLIQRGDLDPAILSPVNGVLRGSFSFVPAAGTLEAAKTAALSLSVSAAILGFPRIISDAVPLYVATASPPGQGRRLGVSITNAEPVLTVQEKHCLAVNLRVEGIETLDQLFYLYVLIKAPGAVLEGRLLDTSFLAQSAPRTFVGTARVIVPLGSAGLPGIRVFITGFTQFDLSTDSRPVGCPRIRRTKLPISRSSRRTSCA